jgi:predicted Zn-dependent protease
MTTLLFFITSCSRNPVTGKRELNFISKKQELAMGAEYDPQIIAQFGSYEDKNLQNLINRVGLSMAKNSHRPDLDYQFRILDSPVVNAFAVPGGYIYFTRGILAHFNNEAELAGVMGHEIGHITAKHSVKQLTNQTILQTLFVAGIIFSPEFAQLADLANQGIGLLFLRFSRANERESDKLGVQYSTEQGYNAHEMAEFFKTLERMGGEAGSLPQFLSTHPDPGQRYISVNNYTDTLQSRMNISSSQLKVNRNSYLDLIDGIIVGEDPKLGYVENDRFYHPELRLVFDIPQQWQTNNTPSQVQLIPESGKAVILFELEAGNDLNGAANIVIERNKINVIERNNTTVNGNQALAILGEFTQNSGNSQTTKLRILTYLIKYNNQIYKFIGLSADSDFNGYFGNFQNTMTSFKKLTDSSKINKLPTRLKIVSVKQTGSLKSVLDSYNTDQVDYEKLSLLNGMDLNETIKSGSKIKILEKKK